MNLCSRLRVCPDERRARPRWQNFCLGGGRFLSGGSVDSSPDQVFTRKRAIISPAGSSASVEERTNTRSCHRTLVATQAGPRRTFPRADPRRWAESTHETRAIAVCESAGFSKWAAVGLSPLSQLRAAAPTGHPAGELVLREAACSVPARATPLHRYGATPPSSGEASPHPAPAGRGRRPGQATFGRRTRKAGGAGGAAGGAETRGAQGARSRGGRKEGGEGGRGARGPERGTGGGA